MTQSVRLIGYSRAFMKDLRRIIEDCGLRTRVEKAVPGVPRARRSPTVDIFEAKTRADWSSLSRMKSRKPFLIYSALTPPPALLASLKEKGLVGILGKESSPEEVAFLVNRAFFYNTVLMRRNRRAFVNLPVVLKTDSQVLTTFATSLSRDGIFVVTLSPLPEHATCGLEFNLPGESKRLTTEGKVLYNISINSDLSIIANPKNPFKRVVTHPGMAILFTSLPVEDRARIDQYISGLHF